MGELLRVAAGAGGSIDVNSDIMGEGWLPNGVAARAAPVYLWRHRWRPPSSCLNV